MVPLQRPSSHLPPASGTAVIQAESKQRAMQCNSHRPVVLALKASTRRDLFASSLDSVGVCGGHACDPQRWRVVF